MSTLDELQTIAERYAKSRFATVPTRENVALAQRHVRFGRDLTRLLEAASRGGELALRRPATALLLSHVRSEAKALMGGGRG
jgi:hypothetical protein